MYIYIYLYIIQRPPPGRAPRPAEPSQMKGDKPTPPQALEAIMMSNTVDVLAQLVSVLPLAAAKLLNIFIKNIV